MSYPQPIGQEYSGKDIVLDPQDVVEGQGEIVLDITIPDGYKVNDLAPFSMEWTSTGDVLRLDSESADQRIVAPSFPLTVPVDFHTGETTLTGELVIYYCEEETQSLCLIERVRLQVPVTVNDEGSKNDFGTLTGIMPAVKDNSGSGVQV